jgi:hypothetical protein
MMENKIMRSKSHDLLFSACPRISRATFFAECRACQTRNCNKIKCTPAAALHMKDMQTWAGTKLRADWLGSNQ